MRHVLIALTGFLLMSQANAKPLNQAPLPFAGKRLAFLGDSITDGHTHLLLVEESLRAAGIQPPICTNVAVAGNKASDLLKRLERDVLPFAPDYLLLSIGVNDANTGVAPETYDAQMIELLDRLEKAGIQVIIMTPTPVIGKRGPGSTPLLEAYLTTLSREATARALRGADIYGAFMASIAEGGTPHGGDGIHLGFDGYLVMARTTLDAMGYADVEVVNHLEFLKPMPGIVETWEIRVDGESEWQPLSLPVPGPAPDVQSDDWWLDQERCRGFAVKLPAPEGKKFTQGRSTITTTEAKTAYLNTGAGLQTIHLNGELVYTNPKDSGWHAGRERLPVALQAGDNQIAITFGGGFFLSLTETNTW